MASALDPRRRPPPGSHNVQPSGQQPVPPPPPPPPAPSPEEVDVSEAQDNNAGAAPAVQVPSADDEGFKLKFCTVCASNNNR